METVERLLALDGVVEVAVRENTVTIKTEYDGGQHPAMVDGLLARAKEIVGDEYAVGTYKA